MYNNKIKREAYTQEFLFLSILILSYNFHLFIFLFFRDALNLLKMSPARKATPAMAAPAAPSPVPTPAAAPPPPGSRPNIPPLSVPGKPGVPVSTPHTICLSLRLLTFLVLQSLSLFPNSILVDDLFLLLLVFLHHLQFKSA